MNYKFFFYLVVNFMKTEKQLATWEYKTSSDKLVDLFRPLQLNVFLGQLINPLRMHKRVSL